MPYNRRHFLKNTGLLASGIAVAGLGAGCASSGNRQSNTSADSAATGSSTATGARPLDQFGLQLYTLRDDLPKDPKGILRQIASFGYKQIEGYEGELGLFWGMKNTELKQYLDELGLTMVASHCKTDTDLDRKAAEAAEIGMKYLINPYIGAQKTIDDYKRFAENFNRSGEVCKKHGIRFAYHNHGYTFEQLEGQYPQDVLMQNTSPDLVDYEMDIYWVVVPGADPEAWLKKYPNRFRLCHVKDRLKTAPAGEDDASTDIGTGSIDFKRILRTAADNGMQYYIVEQERYDNSTPLKSAQADAEYMKNLAF